MTDTTRTDAARFTAYVVDSTMRKLDCDVVHASEYAKLESELAAMELRAMDCVKLNERQAVNFAKCQEELAEARKDAERYRWLKLHADYSLPSKSICLLVCDENAIRFSSAYWEEQIDAAIDAARRERGQG